MRRREKFTFFRPLPQVRAFGWFGGGDVVVDVGRGCRGVVPTASTTSRRRHTHTHARTWKSKYTFYTFCHWDNVNNDDDDDGGDADANAQRTPQTGDYKCKCSLHERTDGRAGGVVVVDSRNSNILLAEI